MKRIVLLMVAFAGCTELRTEVVVVVNKYGITIGKDVDGLQIIVKNGDNADPIYESDKHPLCPDGQAATIGCWSLPVTATLVPGPSNPNDNVVVEVLGLRGGAQVIGDQATFKFLKHVSQRLDFVLYGNCLNVDCTTQNAACNYDGECEPIAPTNFNGDPQLDGLPPGLLPDLGNGGGGDLSSTGDMHTSGNDDMTMSMSTDLAGGGSTDLRGSDMRMSDMMSTTLPDWTAQNSHTTKRLRAVWAWTDNNVVAAGDGGTILYTSDGGTTWSAALTGQTTDLYAAWGTSDGGHLFAVGDSGLILDSLANGGASWSTGTASVWTLPAIDLRGLWADANNTFWVVGKGNTLGTYTSISGWQQVCGTGINDATQSYNTVWGIGTGLDFWVGGHDNSKAVVAIEQPSALCSLTGGDPSGLPSGSPTFDMAMLPEDLACVNSCPQPVPSPPGTDVLGMSGVAASDNALTVGPTGIALSCNNAGPACVNSSSGVVTQLNSVSYHDSLTIAWAVGNGGVILHHGASWSPENSGSTANLNGVYTHSGLTKAWAVGDNGTILVRSVP